MVESDGLLNRCRLNPYPGFESRTLRAGLLLFGVFAFLTVSSSVQAQEPTSSSPTAQYLSQRRAAPLIWGLTLEKIRLTPGAYKGKAVEIEGTVVGISPSNDGGGLIILKTVGISSHTLRMPLLPRWLQTGAEVRALCMIVQGNDDDSTVIGLPEMELIAVASALDIRSLEARWKEEQAQLAAQRAVAEQERQKQAKAAIQAAPPPRITLSSRATPSSRATLSSRSMPIKSTTFKKQIVIGPARYEDLSAGARAVFPIYRDFIRNHNKRLSENEANQITYAILSYSEQMDMEPRLIVATVIAESDFKVLDRSRAGAMGLIQLMPDEVARLKLTNPYDPIQNIAAGIFLLKERLNKYSGSSNFADATDQQIILTLASYNAGEGAVKKHGGVPPYKETQGYVKKIMRLYKELRGVK